MTDSKTPECEITSSKSKEGGLSPLVQHNGTAPKSGESFKFVAPNGVTYRGKVAEVVSEDGKCLIAFDEQGLEPVAPK